MNRNWSFRGAVSVGRVGLLAAALVTACARAEAGNQPPPSGSEGLLGVVLPALTLRSVEGDTVSLPGRVARGPSLIIVLGVQDCFSCSSYRLELNILKSKLPGVSPILIGSGSDQGLFRDYFRRDHLESVALLDPEGSLLASLGVRAEPLVLLVDATGRILFADTRSSSAAAQFPFGRLLPLLGAALQPPSSLSPKTGEPK